MSIDLLRLQAWLARRSVTRGPQFLIQAEYRRDPMRRVRQLAAMRRGQRQAHAAQRWGKGA